jgi:opacity protein-like surface antigen
MRKLFLAAATALFTTSAFAADLPIPMKYGATLGSPCTVSPLSCTGFYGGAWLGGVATSIDVLGSGISNSLFASGAVPGINGGWQYATGTYYFALEVGVGDQFSTTAQVNGSGGNQNGVLGYQEIQAGLSLAGLIGPQTPVPTNFPFPVIAPYVSIGVAERSWGDGTVAGAGVKYDLTPHIMLDVKYRYINYSGAAQSNGNARFTNENIVSIGAEYKF